MEMIFNLGVVFGILIGFIIVQVYGLEKANEGLRKICGVFEVFKEKQ